MFLLIPMQHISVSEHIQRGFIFSTAVKSFWSNYFIYKLPHKFTYKCGNSYLFLHIERGQAQPFPHVKLMSEKAMGRNGCTCLPHT